MVRIHFVYSIFVIQTVNYIAVYYEISNIYYVFYILPKKINCAISFYLIELSHPTFSQHIAGRNKKKSLLILFLTF